MKCSYERLSRDIDRGVLSSIYLFCGPDELLKEEAVQRFIGRFAPPHLRDFNLDILYGGETDWTQVVSRVATLPMMAERRVVVVRNVNQMTALARRNLLKHLGEPMPHAVLILTSPEVNPDKQSYRNFSDYHRDRRLYSQLRQFFGNLERIACRVDFYPHGEDQLPAWVQSRLEGLGKCISPEAVQMLCDAIGDNLIALNNEIEKLSIFVGERAEIGPQDVELVVGQMRGRTVFQLCDAVGLGDLKGAIGLLGNLLDGGVDPFYIIGQLRGSMARWVTGGRGRKGGKSGGRAFAVQSRGRPHGEVEGKPVRDLEGRDLEEVFTRLYQTELNLKTGTQKPRTALTLLICRLCRPEGDWRDE